MSGLPAKKLSEIAAINPRFAGAFSSAEKVSFVRMASVDAETAQIQSTEDRSLGEVRKGYTPFRDGDLLVAKITPCFENGKIAQANLPLPLGFGSTEFHVIRPLPDKVAPRYLLRFLRMKHVRLQGERQMTGSAGQRRVPEQFLANLKVPLPRLSEQERISAMLDRADALRAKRREALAYLDDLTQSIFLDMFGDPVLNSRELAIARLGELGELDRGVSRHRPRNDAILLGGPYPLIQTGDVSNSGLYIESFSQTYSDVGLAQSKLWPAGTLCITIAANIAKTGILRFDACFPDSVVGFTSDNGGLTLYVQAVLSFMQDILEKKAPESAQKNINLETLRSLPVPVPSLDLLEEFARRVEAVERIKERQRAHLAELDDLFESLQQRAFRGDL